MVAEKIDGKLVEEGEVEFDNGILVADGGVGLVFSWLQSQVGAELNPVDADAAGVKVVLNGGALELVFLLSVIPKGGTLSLLVVLLLLKDVGGVWNWLFPFVSNGGMPLIFPNNGEVPLSDALPPSATFIPIFRKYSMSSAGTLITGTGLKSLYAPNRAKQTKTIIINPFKIFRIFTFFSFDYNNFNLQNMSTIYNFDLPANKKLLIKGCLLHHYIQ